MEKYRVVVTDITEFGKLRCVAGWDLDRDVMVRPEPHPGGFWPAYRIGPGRSFERGHACEFMGRVPPPATAYPHRTEDRVVVGTASVAERLDRARLHAVLALTVSKDLDELFSGFLIVDQHKAYVPKGANCRSLGAIEVSTSDIEIFGDRYGAETKVRCRIAYRGQFLKPTLTSDRSHEIHAAKGIAGLRQMLKRTPRAHLRIGLARAFPAKPDRCYLQINGIYSIQAREK